MVQIIPRDCTSNVVHVGVWILALNREYFGSCEALPVETDRVEEAREVGSEKGNKFDRIRSDKEVLNAIVLETDYGGREEILE